VAWSRRSPRISSTTRWCAACHQLARHQRAGARRRALRTLAAQRAGILDALPPTSPCSIAGTIVTVNQAWKRFAAANDLVGVNFGIGDNYVAICAASRAPTPRRRRRGDRHSCRAARRAEHLHARVSLSRTGPAALVPPHGHALAAGRTEGAVVMHVDVTDRHLAEADARRLADELEARVHERTARLDASVEELEAFSYSVSHDLRAPLRHVAGFSQALHDEYGAALPARAQGYVEQIQSAVQRMERLIQALLGLSRVTWRRCTPRWSTSARWQAAIVAELRAAEPDRPIEAVIARASSPSATRRCCASRWRICCATPGNTPASAPRRASRSRHGT